MDCSTATSVTPRIGVGELNELVWHLREGRADRALDDLQRLADRNRGSFQEVFERAKYAPMVRA